VGGLDRLRHLVCELTALCDGGASEPEVLDRAGASLRDLVSTDDWLPAEFPEPDPAQYRQYLLYCDTLERFSLVSFVWVRGSAPPLHDHTVWGLIGMPRGAEISRNYAVNAASVPTTLPLSSSCAVAGEPGVTANAANDTKVRADANSLHCRCMSCLLPCGG
jgi:predicted metal-dependent enzyme (double-stranded beta helix superfamily)